MNNNSNQSIEQYIEEQKASFGTAVKVCAIVLIITFLLWCKIKENIQYLLLFELGTFILILISHIATIMTFNRIKKYAINHNIEKEIQNILYWNYHELWLTDNYVIINKGIKVVAFPYKDIKKINKAGHYGTEGVFSTPTLYKDLIIELHNEEKYKVMIYNTSMNFEGVIKDITPILLEKNKNIVQEKDE